MLNATLPRYLTKKETMLCTHALRRCPIFQYPPWYATNESRL